VLRVSPTAYESGFGSKVRAKVKAWGANARKIAKSRGWELGKDPWRAQEGNQRE
jgi:hypothetical protein